MTNRKFAYLGILCLFMSVFGIALLTDRWTLAALSFIAILVSLVYRTQLL